MNDFWCVLVAVVCTVGLPMVAIGKRDEKIAGASLVIAALTAGVILELFA